MQNSVLSAEAGSASLQGICVMSAKSGLDLLPGFTSTFGAGGPPHLDIDFPVWQSLFESLASNGALVGFRMAFVPHLRF
jgi:hypothetical protein